VSDALIVVRAIYFIAALQLFGLLIFRLLFSPARLTGRDFRRFAFRLVASAMIAMIAWLPLEAGAMSGENIGDVFGEGTLATVLTATRFGHLWIARLALFVMTGASLRWSGRAPVVVAAIFAGLSLGLSAASGHAGAGGALQLTGDTLHLLAIGAWIGGLLPFALTLFDAGVGDLSPAYQAARRFSWLGIFCVAAIFATGIVNSWFLVGNLPALIGTEYGHLLLIKLALFAVIVGFAAVNRIVLTPRIRAGAAVALAALKRNAAIEAALGLAVVAIAGALGTLPPALHDQSVWPFAYRLEWTPWPKLAPAYPTSFAYSPIPYAAPAIARGQSVYASNCVPCHGADGRGDGPLAASLAVKPADLTATHVFGHGEGDLFWWIGHGIGGAMPAFADVLSERDIWAAIAFIRARAAAAAAQSVAVRVGSGFAPPMPDFAFEVGGRQNNLRALAAGSAAILVLFDGAVSPGKRRLWDEEEPQLRGAGLVPLAIGLGDAARAFPARVTPDVAAILRWFERDSAATSYLLLDSAGNIRAASVGLPDAARMPAEVAKMKQSARPAPEYHH
jgi:copper resistance protein D